MAEITYTVNGVTIAENSVEEWVVNGIQVSETEAAPAGAIMNQLQGANLGADLFDGTLVI